MKGEIDMKVRGLLWGLFFIAAGALIIANQLGVLIGLSLWTLILTILLLPIVVESAVHLNFFGVFFGMAGLGIVYAEPLGVTAITPWPILITALFLSIGFTIIFGKYHRHHWEGIGCSGHNHENFSTVVNSADESDIDYGVSFNSSIKYVNSEDLKNANFSCSFGALKLYFDNSIINENGATIRLDVSFGAAELYIPKAWRVSNNLNVSLSGVEEKNRSNPSPDAPVVTLIGNLSFSGVEIIYV